MAIRLFSNSIQIGNFFLTEYANGLSFGGVVESQIFTPGLRTLNEIAAPASPLYGTVAGYTPGGYQTPPPGLASANVVDKFPFATNANATDVGDLTVGRYYGSGQSSQVSGYVSGGSSPVVNTIDKFPFATNANATDVGDLTVARTGSSGQSSTDNGYASGGAFPVQNTIDKFPFATNANATDVGDLTLARYYFSGQSSDVSGYASGGADPTLPTVNVNNIDKFPFASNANATDVGDLTETYYGAAGQSSPVSGYNSGGLGPPSYFPRAINIINKFPFASNANATDVGDLTQGRYFVGGQSSDVSGYTTGGNSFPGRSNVIDKFPFATNANATDVGDITTMRTSSGGQQD